MYDAVIKIYTRMQGPGTLGAMQGPFTFGNMLKIVLNKQTLVLA